MLKPKQNMLKPIMNLKTMKYMNKIMYLAICEIVKFSYKIIQFKNIYKQSM